MRLRFVTFAVIISSLLSLLVVNAPADAATTSDIGCNFATCIVRESYAGGLYVVQAYLVPAYGGYGHFHLWGPGLDRNTVDKFWSSRELTPRMGGGGDGSVCAQFWLWVNDHWEAGWGLPCISTH